MDFLENMGFKLVLLKEFWHKMRWINDKYSYKNVIPTKSATRLTTFASCYDQFKAKKVNLQLAV